jgi:hypothetical protein
MDEGTILVYWCPSIFSLTSPPSQTKCTVYTGSVCLGGGKGGGVELCCRPYPAGILHSVSDQIQNLPKCFTTTPNKMTSEDDIKGLVSLKFLRPCSIRTCTLHHPLPIQSLMAAHARILVYPFPLSEPVFVDVYGHLGIDSRNRDYMKN